MAEWSKLIPSAGAPAKVEAARRAVEALQSRVAGQRQALETARAGVVEAEQADRVRMAQQLRRGRQAQADDATIDKARQRVASVQREGEALGLGTIQKLRWGG